MKRITENEFATRPSTSCSEITDQIGALPPNWHDAGTMSGAVIRAIEKCADELGAIQHTAETGAGKTTLLFSRMSPDHTAFTLDIGGSMSHVIASPLFVREHVTFIVGPTQLTLPRYNFTCDFDMVLIDGPHAYPFPDLEYYYLYPRIRCGAFLIVDDINIPTIRRMFDILRADAMFELVEIAETTAFFRRTTAELCDPCGDGWWLQGYNRGHYEHATARENAGATAKFLSRTIPQPLKHLVPQVIKTRLLRRL